MNRVHPQGRHSRLGQLERMLPAVYFVFVFLLYWSLLSHPYFTDEQDVLFGGYYIARGRELYRSYLTQHMPFSYYFAALPASLGARTVFQYRAGMYLLMAGCWEAVFLRHRKALHPAALFALPALYLAFLKNIPMGTTMISDHWQGIGHLMVLLEVVRYADTKEISLPCALMVSLGILLSFGTVFLAAYPLFCCFLAVVWIQIRMLWKAQKAGAAQRKALARRLVREDLRLAGICLAPFAALAAVYACTGNLLNAYRGAYEVNVRYYAQYAGGLGSDPLGLFGDGVRNWFLHLGELIQAIPARPGASAVCLLSALGLLFFAIWMGRKSPAAGLLIFLSTVYGGIRTFDSFHGMAYYAQLSAVLCVLMSAGLRRLSAVPSRPLRRGSLAVLCGLSVILLADFGIWCGYNLIYPRILLPQTPRAEEQLLDLLTEPGEEIAACDTPVFCQMVMDLELISADACDAVSIPWYYAMWKDQAMASIQKHPRVVLYNPEEKSWGYVFREYAVEFDAYVRAHYTPVAVSDDLWVLNEYLPEASARMQAAGYGNALRSNAEDITPNTPAEYLPGQAAEGRFVAEGDSLCAVRFCASCFHRRSDPVLTVRILEEATGETVGEGRITGDGIADTFFSRCPVSARLIPGQAYTVRFTVEEIGGKGDMEFYFTPSGALALAEEYDDL